MKTQKEVRDYALNARDWLYVWGANGETITKGLMDKLLKTYGSKTYNKEYYDRKLAKGEGKMAADCSGFMHPLSGYDNTANGYYNQCSQKGAIGSLPKDKVCLVFKARGSGTMHHIGIYLGDGTVAEMASSDTDYQHRSLGATNWSHWGMPKWIDYSKPIAQEPGWIHVGDRWQYLKANGTYMKNGWMLINHHWYLFDNEGWMLTGWQQKAGKWYYLEESGDYEGACWHGTADNDGSLERWYVG